MTDDILRQAELRHQRRPRSRQGEEILPLDTAKLKPSSGGDYPDLLTAELPVKSSLPPIRRQGSDKARNNRNLSPCSPRVRTHSVGNREETLAKRESAQVSIENGLLSPLDRPRTPRRRIASHTDNDDVIETKDNTPCLPFVKCMLKDRDVKALISTITPKSTISKRCLDLNRSSKGSLPKEIKIAGNELPVALTIEDSGLHDLVLGLDFLLQHKCVLDFGRKQLQFGSGDIEPFLSEDDIPLKFRNKKDPSLSI